jgi:hypothetical protein
MIMNTYYKRVAGIAVGLAAVAAAAITLDVDSLSGWALTAGSAAALSVVVFQVFREPKKSMSQSIQDSLR